MRTNTHPYYIHIHTRPHAHLIPTLFRVWIQEMEQISQIRSVLFPAKNCREEKRSLFLPNFIFLPLTHKLKTREWCRFCSPLFWKGITILDKCSAFVHWSEIQFHARIENYCEPFSSSNHLSQGAFFGPRVLLFKGFTQLVAKESTTRDVGTKTCGLAFSWNKQVSEVLQSFSCMSTTRVCILKGARRDDLVELI